VHVVRALSGEGAQITAYDPAAAHDVTAGIAHVERVDDPYEAANGAEVLVLLTEWDEFKSLDFARVRAALRPPAALVDARNSLDAAALRHLGIEYQGIGR
jgi:UDPglucose 6-dehydrogenase